MEELKRGTGRIVTANGRTINFDLADYTIGNYPGLRRPSDIQIFGVEPKVEEEKPFSFNFDDLLPEGSALAHFFRLETTNKWDEWDVDRILKSGPVTIVFWKDGTKTMVRRAPDEEDNTYAAFTAALAIKLFGSNSALKKMLKQKVEVQKLKKKSTKCTDTCPIDFEAIDKNLQAEKERLNELSEKSQGLTNDA